MRVTRRQFVATAGSAVASLALGNCVGSAQSRPGHDGRLTARLRENVTTSLKSGPLGLNPSGRDGVIQMPSTMPAGKIPLLIFPHGATQNGARMLPRIGPAAEEAGIAVVAPDSRNGTWDAIRNEFDEDIVFLNRALDYIFERVNVDPERLAIGGFSDGASYGLSLGLINGDLFPKIAALSTGFRIPGQMHGKPRVFMSHGTNDDILPIDQCGRKVAADLRRLKYDVTFKEFVGKHEV